MAWEGRAPGRVKMGGRLADQLQGLLMEHHADLPPEALGILEEEQGNLSLFLAYVVLHRRRLPHALLFKLADMLIPPHVSAEHTELLKAAASTHADARLPSPRHLRTFLFSLGSADPPSGSIPPSSSEAIPSTAPPSFSHPRHRGRKWSRRADEKYRIGLIRAVARELHAQGLADDYFYFPPSPTGQAGPGSDGIGRGRGGEVGGGRVGGSSSGAQAALRNSIRLHRVPRPQRGFTVAIWLWLEGGREGGGVEGGNGEFTLFRFLSHHQSKRDTSVEASLMSWGEESWQLVYRYGGRSGGK